jgi:hypothetical protein
VTLRTAGSQTVTAQDTVTGSISGTTGITDTPAAADHFSVSAPSTSVAGAPFDVTVTTLDVYGNVVPTYTGTVHFSTTDGGPTLPADYTFTAGDGGSHTFSGGAAMSIAGGQTLTAMDTAAGLAGSAAVLVTPAAADHLVFLQQPTDTAAGQTISTVIVEVVDAFGNVETSDNSHTITLSLGTNPSGGTLSGTLTLTVVNGVATFSDLAIDLAGVGYTLHATGGGGLPDSDSNPFNITM